MKPAPVPASALATRRHRCATAFSRWNATTRQRRPVNSARTASRGVTAVAPTLFPPRRRRAASMAAAARLSAHAWPNRRTIALSRCRAHADASRSESVHSRSAATSKRSRSSCCSSATRSSKPSCASSSSSSIGGETIMQLVSCSAATECTGNDERVDFAVARARPAPRSKRREPLVSITEAAAAESSAPPSAARVSAAKLGKSAAISVATWSMVSAA
mmetsp:Transcript_26619/g.92521  ORF Transcript_26619/g.92521 Transcript_26619/m.92521 type:complete len:218 (-) Transcript_26619:3126-3779(-)